MELTEERGKYYINLYNVNSFGNIYVNFVTSILKIDNTSKYEIKSIYLYIINV